MSEKSGRCLCGAVQFTAVLTNNEVWVCHCKMCQRWAGGSFLAVGGTPETVFKGEDAIALYSSSEWMERGFCRCCGSPLFARLKSDGSYHIPIGLLDDTEGLELTNEIYIDRKPLLYSFAEKTHKMTEAEFLAMYAASQDKS